MKEFGGHDRGLRQDLLALDKLLARRRALGLLGAVGTSALVAACGGDGSSSSASTGTTATPTPTPSATATATPTPTASATSASCGTAAGETAGPYPGDGTNSSNGITSNALVASGIVRSDIRSSFINSTTTAQASAAEPEPRAGEARNNGIERWLAEELGADPEELRAFTNAPPFPGPGKENTLRGEGSFGWQHNGRWHIVRVDPAPAALPWWVTVAAVTILVLGAIIALAWFSARTITRPLERLAAHVRGDSAELHLVGNDNAPPEVAVVSGALALFQRAQLDLVTQRTRMLSAIAHDMGTPLARLAFRLEALPDAQREAAQADIAAVRRLIEDSLALDRSGSEPATLFDLADLVSAMVAEYQALDLPLTVDGMQSVTVFASNLGLRRLLQNVVDNALRYGSTASVSLASTQAQARLVVRDRGPGFSVDMLHHGCEPFARGEASRNPDTGGNGLGLAIAAAIASEHGGSIELRNWEYGGEVVFSIPAVSCA